MRPSSLVVVLSLSGAFGIVLFGRGEADRPPASTLLPALPTLVSAGDACPLTPAEEKDAVQKFDKMWPVLRHPRCFNCHGGVRPRRRRGGHIGGDFTGPASIDACQDCHSGLKHWDTAPEGFFFTNKTARQLCMQFKKFEADPLTFVRHIHNDKGGTAFTETAFKGDRALNTLGVVEAEQATGRPFEAAPPPITHGEFVQAGSDWANAVGENGWKATPDCGCGRRKSAWTGTVTGVWDLDLDGRLHVVEKTTANVRFELDTTLGRRGRAVYWKSVSGELEWSTEITGECRASASGTVPIDQGSDDNPLAMLSLETEPGAGPRYMVSVGPWRDEYQPRFTLRCPNVSTPGILYGLGVFWHHPDEGIISPDGKTLQGSFQAPHPAGTNAWTWDLQLEQLPADESP